MIHKARASQTWQRFASNKRITRREILKPSDGVQWILNQRILPRPITELRALELGCGNGRDALSLLKLGASVTANDGTPANVEALSHILTDPSWDNFRNRNNLDETAVERFTPLPGLFGEVDLPQTDFLLAQSCLSYCPTYDIFMHVWEQIKAALVPGAVILVDFHGLNWAFRDPSYHEQFAGNMMLLSIDAARALFQGAFEIHTEVPVDMRAPHTNTIVEYMDISRFVAIRK